MWTAIHLRKRLGATLIGEPTSGKPNSPGEVQTVKLPVSGLELQYSTKNWLRDPDADPPSLMPDLPVAGKAADYFARPGRGAGRRPGRHPQAPARPPRRRLDGDRLPLSPASRCRRLGPPGYELLRSWVLPKISSFEPSRWLS